MKKIVFTLIFLNGLIFSAVAQQTCWSGFAKQQLYSSKIKATVSNSGSNFEIADKGLLLEQHLASTGTSKSGLCSSGLWVTSVKPDGLSRTAYSRYRNSQADYFIGPIVNGSADCNLGWNKVWKTNREAIQKHIDDYADLRINNTVDSSILSWPAKGNPNFFAIMGFNLPNQDLAPFVDRNNNGNYEPYLGDYPILNPACPTLIPDEFTWTVFNDVGGAHAASFGLPVNVEVQQMHYVFNSTSDVVNRTLFVKYKVINKSTSTIDSMYVANYLDVGLNAFTDDYVGNNSALSSAYIYNSNSNDNFVLTATLLNQTMTNSPYFSASNLSRPFTSYTSGLRNGTIPLTDKPSLVGGNSQYAQNAPSSAYIIIPGTGPHRVSSGAFMELEIAYTYHNNPSYTNLTQVDNAFTEVQQIKTLYNNGCFNSSAQTALCSSNCVWPGDTDNNGIVNNHDFINLGLTVNRVGSARSQFFTGWLSKEAPLWSSNVPRSSLNTCYTDCNGDGSIKLTDYTVVENNYGFNNYKYSNWGGYTRAGNELSFIQIANPLTRDTILSPTNRDFVVYALLNLPDTAIYGFAATIVYNPAILNISLITPQGWGYSFAKKNGNGTIDIAFCNKNNQNRRSDSRLIYIRGVLNSTAGSSLATDSTIFTFKNYRALLSDGSDVIIGHQPKAIYFKPFTQYPASVENGYNEANIKIYPNPNNGRFSLVNDSEEMVSYTVFNPLGQLVSQSDVSEKSTKEINLEQASSGVYYVKVRNSVYKIHVLR